jgi:integrase
MKQRETKKCRWLLANFNVCPFPAVSLRTVLLQHFVSDANGQRERDTMRTKLNDAYIRSRKPRDKQYAIGDTACIGLCLRVTPKGAKSFAFAYRSKATGKVVWLTIGRYPGTTLSEAREHADKARKVAGGGGTPVLTAKAENAKTYAHVVEQYHDEYLKTLRSGHRVHTILQRIGRIYGWNDRPIASITDDTAHAMLTNYANVRGKKKMANRVKQLLHTMFKWAKQPGRKYVAVNPFSDLPAPGGPKEERERFLEDDEIRQLWRALDNPEALGLPWDIAINRDIATVCKLILVTAARPGMVSGIASTELCDLSGPSTNGPHWSLSAVRMKNEKPFITPLSGLALELLQPHFKAGQIFSLAKHHLDTAARLIVAKLAMKRWTPHDLRRTAATILDRKGYSLDNIGHLLAHSRKGITKVYARWEHFDLKRRMATVLAQQLREILQVADMRIAA